MRSSIRSAPETTRRDFLGKTVAAGASCLTLGAAVGATEVQAAAKSAADDEPFFKTRGVVLLPNDIINWPWVRKAKAAGLTTFGTHYSPQEVEEFFATDAGEAFQEECRASGMEIEHELHSMSQLLPRDLFKKDPAMFAMDKKGDRTPQSNLCVHSKKAVEIVCENAVKYAEILRPTTGRYFYWIDDGQPMCACPECRGFSDTDQALILENAMVKALGAVDSRATLAHLSYHGTLAPPTRVKPSSNVFLEFAPITRDYKSPFGSSPREKAWLEHLDANLELFGAETAQVLEYWLDESMFYRATTRDRAKRHMVPIPWSQEVFEADLDIYGKRGIRHVTTFAVMVHKEYVEKFGEPPLNAYGQGLKNWRPG